ncbi:hypothetical protein Q763_17600 [Flavobacterium beibuense F44-8]|uniref:DNA-binding protein n=1 Tax=Flavobacterium beibuense F44-8 TaxID=1406840 RepID=A0A0A2LER0_9FLAO|nr:type IA DNA topoisomerase [Flavobacterium beibuense]KGO78602.1 hypothetical protein Q763_17600 [Flavobacterium beibuense F44-8]
MYQIEVQPNHMLAVLELFKPLWAVEEKELPFIVAGTLATIKEKIKKGDPAHYGEAEFRVKDMRAKLKISPATFARHINTLYDYGRIERTGGNRREGFTYRICHWEDTATAIDQYQALKEAINSL